jgi:hypothetical protein
MQEEQEDPTAITGGVMGDMSGGGGVLTALISAGSTLVLTLLAYAFKRGRSGANLEDAQNDVSIETIVSARARIKELEEQVKALLNDGLQASRAQVASELAAERAGAQASLAQEAAQRANIAARAAKEEVEEVRKLAYQRKLYINTLINAMRAAGMDIPPEPQ